MDEVKPVKILHKKLPTFQHFHADGAWGTINADSIVELNFFLEQPPLVSAIEHELIDGKVSQHGKIKDEDTQFYVVEREFVCGVCLSSKALARLHKVLGEFLSISNQQESKQETASK